MNGEQDNQRNTWENTITKAKFTKKTLAKQPARFRIEAIISDGMWYSLSKWQKMSGVTELELMQYVDEAMEEGTVVQSPTGANSYRMTCEAIVEWYEKHGWDHRKDQLLDFVFPPRIWAGITEPEGFLTAPVREIGIVSFVAPHYIFEEVREALRGIAKVREVSPGKYKAYGLNSGYVKERVAKVVQETKKRDNIEALPTKVYGRQISRRREMVDFDPEFAQHLVMFYKEFGKSLVKESAKTISIFISSPDDRDAQVLMWILEAIEKFDESASVPFSGYLNTVLKRWPYSLPSTFLGKELSQFQKNRAKAINTLKNALGKDTVLSYDQIAEEMGVDMTYFSDLEEKHKAWIGTKNAEPLIWEDRGEEKTSAKTVSMTKTGAVTNGPNHRLSHCISMAAVEAGLETGDFQSVYSISGQIDSGNVNKQSVKDLSEDFVSALGERIAEKRTGTLKKVG